MTYEEMYEKAQGCLDEIEESLCSVEVRMGKRHNKHCTRRIMCTHNDLISDSKVLHFLYARFLVEGMDCIVKETFEDYLKFFNVCYRLQIVRERLLELVKCIDRFNYSSINLIHPDDMWIVNSCMRDLVEVYPDDYKQTTGLETTYNLHSLEDTIEDVNAGIEKIYKLQRDHLLFYCEASQVLDCKIIIREDIYNLFLESFRQSIKNSQNWIIKELEDCIINFRERLHGSPTEDDWRRMYERDMQACCQGNNYDFQDDESFDDILPVGEREDIYAFFEIYDRINMIANKRKYKLVDISAFYNQGLVERELVLEEYSLGCAFSRIHRLNLMKIGMNPVLKSEYESFLGFRIDLPCDIKNDYIETDLNDTNEINYKNIDDERGNYNELLKIMPQRFRHNESLFKKYVDDIAEIARVMQKGQRATKTWNLVYRVMIDDKLIQKCSAHQFGKSLFEVCIAKEISEWPSAKSIADQVRDRRTNPNTPGYRGWDDTDVTNDRTVCMEIARYFNNIFTEIAPHLKIRENS